MSRVCPPVLPLRFVLILLVGAAANLPVEALANPLRDADILRWRGRYEEAIERYASEADEHPVATAVGIARCEQETGQQREAEERLQVLHDAHSNSLLLLAELARLAFDRGAWEMAAKHAAAAVEREPNNTLARWLVAEMARCQGRLDEAATGYRWFHENYRLHAMLPADDLRWLGKGLAQHARWQRDGGQFRRLVNEFYPRVLREHEAFWPARVESARLFLEKYNEPEATRELNVALAVNPRSAEAHALRARLALVNFDLKKSAAALQQALEVNPHLLEARQLSADLSLAELNTAEAMRKLETARDLNPRDEDTLGRLAAIHFILDPRPADRRWEDGETQFAQLLAEVTERNPRAGRFYQVAGESCELMRRFPQAAELYEQALRRMPQLIDVRGQLGLTLMRLGDEPTAARLLDESFAIDPFNVRVKNMLEVLDVLKGYAVLETEHFVLRFDRGLDELLAEEMADYLEQDVYPELVAKLGFAPPEKTLIEIFNRAKNTDGHGWFSARMVGLPFIGTVGACAGKVVALASPNGLAKRYNWSSAARNWPVISS